MDTERGSFWYDRWLQRILSPLIVSGIIGGFVAYNKINESIATLKSDGVAMSVRQEAIIDKIEKGTLDRYTATDAAKDREIYLRWYNDHEARIRKLEQQGK